MESIVKEFVDNFKDYKDLNIAIYGIGIQTEVLLEGIKEFNIVGLLDNNRTSGSIYGMPIISLENAIEGNVKLIVIVARTSSRNIIYRRISSLCKEKNVRVFDVYGNEFIEDSRDKNVDNEYFSVSAEELNNKIDSNDIISFDIFDTLIMRKTLFPTDVFEIVKRKIELTWDFVSIRIEAEKCIKERRFPSIHDIYDEIQKKTNISDDQKDKLMKLELLIESEVIIPRKDMVEIFRNAVNQGKRVFLISDMYLTKKELEPLLDKIGIYGYEEIFISCEADTDKRCELFSRFKEKIEGEKILHIGDSVECDIESAQKYGIDTFLVRSAVDMLQISSYSRLLDFSHTLQDRVYVGMFISKLFNSPFSLYKTNGKGIINNDRKLVYLFAAPVITNYIFWLIKKTSEMNIDKVLFPARDGLLLNKLYNRAIKKFKLTSMPESIYFLSSREICVISSILSEKELKYAFNFTFSGSLSELLKERFLLEKSEIFLDESNDRDKCISTHKETILIKSREQRERYLDYLKKCGINQDQRMAFGEFIGSGTCQLGIEKILSTKMVGLYFTRTHDIYEEKQMLDIKSLYSDGDEVSANQFILENILTSNTSSFKCFDKHGEFVFYEEKRSVKEIGFVEEAHRAVEEYFEEYTSLLSYYDYEKVASPEIILGLIKQNYSILDSTILHEQILNDEFCNRIIYTKECLS